MISSNHMKKSIIIVALLFLGGLGAWAFYPKLKSPVGIACTMEAKLCPDGSYALRSGPKCEFAECPSVNTTTAKEGIGFGVNVSGAEITPLKVIEDSRCPIGAMCIQAGTVKLKTTLTLGASTEVAILTLNQFHTFANHQIELTNVLPAKFQHNIIKPEDYRFEFSVTPVAVSENGKIQGVMTIGPICPVERVDQPCLPTPEMFLAHKIFVYAANKTKLIDVIIPDSMGQFSESIPAGRYYVDMTHQGIGKISGVPTTINIQPGKTVTLNIDVDTGIR